MWGTATSTKGESELNLNRFIVVCMFRLFWKAVARQFQISTKNGLNANHLNGFLQIIGIFTLRITGLQVEIWYIRDYILKYYNILCGCYSDMQRCTAGVEGKYYRS